MGILKIQEKALMMKRKTDSSFGKTLRKESVFYNQIEMMKPIGNPFVNLC